MTRTEWKQLLFPFLVFSVTGISYLYALEAEFVWDDYEYVVDNMTLRSWDGLRRIWFDPRANPQYYPIVYSSFWIEYQIWQLGPIGYHLTNILLHALNALLVWALLRKFSLKGAWLAALIFALHPVHVESVAWVSERKNVLSGLFYLSAALAYLGFRGLDPERGTGRWRWYGLAFVLFACALLSKSVTASLPAAILLVLFWKTGSVRSRDVVLLIPFFAGGIAAGLNTAWLERVHVGAAGPIWDLTLLERILIASRALCHYVTQLFWPNPLMFSYPRWNIDASQGWQYLYGIALCGLLFLLWKARSIRRGPLVAALFFAGTLFPALGFVDLYPMRFSFVADHFQYLASLGVIVPVAAGISEVGHKIRDLRPGWAPETWRAAQGVLLLALATVTFSQTRIYRDEETIWHDTLRKNPESWMSHNNLGRIHGFRGELEQALRHFQATIELYPDYYVAETNLAETLSRLGRYPEAVDHLRHVLELEPDHADAHFFLWVALSQLGQMDEAIHHLQRETQLNPGFQSHFRASRLLAGAGRPREALLELDHAERFRQDGTALAIVRGNILLTLGNARAAALYYREAIAHDLDSDVVRNNLGLALERSGSLDRAEEEFIRAIRLNPNHPDARANLKRLRAQRSAE